MSQSELDFDRIGEGVMMELNRRLGAPELAQDLPGTLLMKVAMDYVKHLEKRNEIEQAKLDQEHIDPLEMIDQPGIPLDMRIEILYEYIGELETYWTTSSNRLEELLQERNENASSEDAVQGLPDLVSEGGPLPGVWLPGSGTEQDPDYSEAEQPPLQSD